MPTFQGKSYPYTKAGYKAVSRAKQKVKKTKLKRVGKKPRRTA